MRSGSRVMEPGVSPPVVADTDVADPSALDAGVREVVELLNHIPGVTTRASCEGTGLRPARHRHADPAYVALRYPMPLQLRDFLVAQLGTLARIEDDSIYSRWPARNPAFLEGFAAAARSYLRQAADRRLRVHWPLARLRARVARQVSRAADIEMAFCMACADLVTAPHRGSHQRVPVLRLPANQQERWFSEFVAQPENQLAAVLVATDGWGRLTARTLRGDFGAAFRRRWLRYRACKVAQLTTLQLRSGVDDARRCGIELDFFYNDTFAVFAWDPNRTRPRYPLNL